MAECFKSTLQSAVSILELIYHATVRDARKTHGNALMAIGLNILQALVFLAAFYVMFAALISAGQAALNSTFSSRARRVIRRFARRP